MQAKIFWPQRRSFSLLHATGTPHFGAWSILSHICINYWHYVKRGSSDTTHITTITHYSPTNPLKLGESVVLASDVMSSSSNASQLGIHI
jgi:hypothetical protein